MRFLIALILPALVALPAFAKAKANTPVKSTTAPSVSEFSGELLTYRQLMKLPKAKRMKYIRDTVDLLATMESFNNRYTTAEIDRIRDLREKVAYLMQMMAFMPEAKAAEYDDAVVDEDLSKLVPSLHDGQWTCGRKAIFDYAFRACVALNPAGTSVFTPHNVTDGGTDGRQCPAGTQEVPHYRPGMAACIPNANWARIPQERRAELGRGKVFSKRSTLEQLSPQQQRQAVFGPQTAPTAPAAVSGTPAAPEVYGPPAPSPANPPAPATQIGSSNPSAGPAAVTAPSTPAAGSPPATPAAGTPPAPAPEVHRACEPAPRTCKNLSEAERRTAIQRFRQTEKYQGEDANVCIAGGFASKYRGGKKDPGNCEIWKSIPLPGGKTTKACGSDEALCNPVLFCLGGKNSRNEFEPVTFCVKTNQGGDRRNRAITEACATKYARILDNKEAMITCKVDPKLRGKAKRDAEAACAATRAIKAQACDATYTPGGDFKRIWDDLVAQTKKLRDVWCGNGDFAALFCRECEIVNDKIYGMNKDATRSGCAELAPGVEAAPVAPTQGSPEGVREGPEAAESPEARSRRGVSDGR